MHSLPNTSWSISLSLAPSPLLLAVTHHLHAAVALGVPSEGSPGRCREKPVAQIDTQTHNGRGTGLLETHSIAEAGERICLVTEVRAVELGQFIIQYFTIGEIQLFSFRGSSTFLPFSQVKKPEIFFPLLPEMLPDDSKHPGNSASDWSAFYSKTLRLENQQPACLKHRGRAGRRCP